MCQALWAKGSSVPGTGNSLCKGPVTGEAGNFKSPIEDRSCCTGTGQVMRGHRPYKGVRPLSQEPWGAVQAVELVSGKI